MESATLQDGDDRNEHPSTDSTALTSQKEENVSISKSAREGQEEENNDVNEEQGEEGEEGEEEGEEEELTCSVKVNFPQEKYGETWRFAPSWTVDNLVLHCADTWPAGVYDWDRAKFLVERRRPDLKGGDGVLKAQQDGAVGIAPLDGNTLRVMAPRRAAVESLEEAARAAAAAQQARRARFQQHRKTTRTRTRQGMSSSSSADPLADAQYTFHTIEPLPHLPRPERSRAFLERLRDDPGIRAAMRAHRFSVGLLTEMDPLSYTASSHEGTTRVLGLNRNRGEAIELRLRTDAYDGYRDYRTIRNTLCHELAHNVHGPHDRAFWDLCHQIEREVRRADWTSGGHTVGDEEFAPSRGGEEADEDVVDHGGWEGGEFVLGGGSSTRSGAGAGGGTGTDGLSRREILARAAEERMRKVQQAEEKRKQADGAARDNGEGSAS